MVFRLFSVVVVSSLPPRRALPALSKLVTSLALCCVSVLSLAWPLKPLPAWVTCLACSVSAPVY